ncbi:uncharacterized protein JNUCC1_01077 [Lentibacillus sp. JNUCC-1]|uniref:YesL family protein n=1 Tax=Lentibacillus sp. JNUCC-1 TaxID=2654513 RepID=UPI0012E7624C|nr:DUF624 domain-containing protein [Lentibacillus sp. JNUCC-1]MUV37271.1 uncharacterized protein [Lentibacillus sp. JNUCC-1]
MNNLNGAFKWVYDIGNWLFKLMYLQVLWVAFTLLGLVLFGLFPATAGVYAVVRKWTEYDYDVPIFKTFLANYKGYFLKVNGLGYVMFLIGLFLSYDYFISKSLLNSFFLHIILLGIILVYVLTLCYIFPTFVHYELKAMQYIKQSFLLMLSNPLETIGMIVCMIILYYLFALLPVVFVFMGMSAIAYPTMRIAYSAFNKVQQKKNP